MNVIIYDLASLRLRLSKDKTTLSLLTANGEMLARIEIAPHADKKESAFLLFDTALSSTRVKHPDVPGRGLSKVAFYNPYSFQVALGAIPKTLNLSDTKPLVIPPSGLAASLSEKSLWVDDRVLTSVEASYASVKGSLQAHQI